jgi:putative membrane protein
MNWHMDDWSWGGWLLMTTTMMEFWALLAWAVVAMVRNGHPPNPQREAPEQILATRFAAGDIDEDDYRRRLDTLDSARAGERHTVATDSAARPAR